MVLNKMLHHDDVAACAASYVAKKNVGSNTCDTNLNETEFQQRKNQIEHTVNRSTTATTTTVAEERTC